MGQKSGSGGRANSKRQDMRILQACRRAREGTFIDLYEAGRMRLTEILLDCLHFGVRVRCEHTLCMLFHDWRRKKGCCCEVKASESVGSVLPTFITRHEARSALLAHGDFLLLVRETPSLGREGWRVAETLLVEKVTSQSALRTDMYTCVPRPGFRSAGMLTTRYGRKSTASSVLMPLRACGPTKARYTSACG
jgi:hypothetical protein